MELLIIFLFAFTVARIVSFLINSSSEKIEPKYTCPPHSWEYKDNKLICKECLKYPGSFTTNNGEY